MPNWEEIQREWETTKITLVALAEKHDLKLGTLKSRKSRDGWSRGAAKKDATIQKDATPKSEKVATGTKMVNDGANKKASSNVKAEKQRNRSGNPNPKNQFTKRNSAAVTHGLFAKYLPEETMDIMEILHKRSPIDLLWDQIQIQYAAIIRAQRVMWVEDADDHLKEESGYSSSDTGGSTSYKVAYAHERYNSFLMAQSRAMSELRSLIKQYDELLQTDLATEEQKARIAVLKSKVPSQNTVDMNKQIVALADLINNPAPNRVIDDD
ncbi:DNA-binding protein [Sporosarcina sp. NCCP-2222]|uniref:phage terminase small subunit n=1 Tax=Sporosarcina sp. NCCP-2222 TaxID=2935073 RepID=UPI0020857A93|nr:phage terminase small subunit [Sporosarcina sp. NCCP-2222]GKV55983.1 DNA-binding protein [Sporosarcina sp. NCCP-2222]